MPPVLRLRSEQRGSTLVVVVVFLVLMGSIVMALLSSIANQKRSGLESELFTRRLLTADGGLAKGRSVVLRDHLTMLKTPPGSGSPTTVVNEAFGMSGAQTLVVTAHHIERSSYPYTFRIVSTATIAGEFRRLELILQVDQPAPPPLSLPWVGAVVAAGDIDVTGSIEINGNDHDPAGNPNPGGVDVHGTVTTGVTNRGGAASIGGSGDAPSTSPDADAMQNNTGAFNPEANPNDDLDDDADGLVDENGFPKSAAEFFNLSAANVAGGAVTNGQLKARAQSQGTYFTSVAAYDAWLAATPTADKGGKVIYLEFPNGNETLGQFNLPHNPPPAKPSLLIVAHDEVVDDEFGFDGDGQPPRHEIEIGPVHNETANGTFQGLLMCDFLKNTNGNGQIVGAVVAFNGIRWNGTLASPDTKFGNGNHDIKFSSEVLANLPGSQPPTEPPHTRLLLWREVR